MLDNIFLQDHRPSSGTFRTATFCALFAGREKWRFLFLFLLALLLLGPRWGFADTRVEVNGRYEIVIRALPDVTPAASPSPSPSPTPIPTPGAYRIVPEFMTKVGNIYRSTQLGRSRAINDQKAVIQVRPPNPYTKWSEFVFRVRTNVDPQQRDANIKYPARIYSTGQGNEYFSHTQNEGDMKLQLEYGNPAVLGRFASPFKKDVWQTVTILSDYAAKKVTLKVDGWTREYSNAGFGPGQRDEFDIQLVVANPGTYGYVPPGSYFEAEILSLVGQ